MTTPIIVYGSLAFDHVLHADRPLASLVSGIELAGTETALCSVKAIPVSFGGNGGNIAWHLALLGTHPHLVSSVGIDGGPYLHRLQAVGIDISNVSILDTCPTTSIWLLFDVTSNSVAFFDDRASRVRTLNISKEVLQDAIVHIAPGKPIVTLQALQYAADVAKQLIWDPGQDLHFFTAEQCTACLSLSTLLILNCHELDVLLRVMEANVSDILRMVAYVVITQGEEGVTVHRRGQDAFHTTAIRPLVKKSSWGAGDAFRSGLLYGLSKREELYEAIQLGCSLASLVMEIDGTQLSCVTERDIRERIRRA